MNLPFRNEVNSESIHRFDLNNKIHLLLLNEARSEPHKSKLIYLYTLRLDEKELETLLRLTNT